MQHSDYIKIISDCHAQILRDLEVENKSLQFKRANGEPTKLTVQMISVLKIVLSYIETIGAQMNIKYKESQKHTTL